MTSSASSTKTVSPGGSSSVFRIAGAAQRGEMHVEDDDHLTRRVQRPALGQRDDLAQVADGDRGAAAAHDVQIGIGAGQGRPAGGALAAPALGTEERGGEPVAPRPGRRSRAGPGRGRRARDWPPRRAAPPPPPPATPRRRRARGRDGPPSPAPSGRVTESFAHGGHDMRRQRGDLQRPVDDEPVVRVLPPPGPGTPRAPCRRSRARGAPSGRPRPGRRAARRAAATSTLTSTRIERSAASPPVAQPTSSASAAGSRPCP